MRIKFTIDPLLNNEEQIKLLTRLIENYDRGYLKECLDQLKVKNRSVIYKLFGYIASLYPNGLMNYYNLDSQEQLDFKNNILDQRKNAIEYLAKSTDINVWIEKAITYNKITTLLRIISNIKKATFIFEVTQDTMEGVDLDITDSL